MPMTADVGGDVAVASGGGGPLVSVVHQHGPSSGAGVRPASCPGGQAGLPTPAGADNVAVGRYPTPRPLTTAPYVGPATPPSSEASDLWTNGRTGRPHHRDEPCHPGPVGIGAVAARLRQARSRWHPTVTVASWPEGGTTDVNASPISTQPGCGHRDGSWPVPLPPHRRRPAISCAAEPDPNSTEPAPSSPPRS